MPFDSPSSRIDVRAGSIAADDSSSFSLDIGANPPQSRCLGRQSSPVLSAIGTAAPDTNRSLSLAVRPDTIPDQKRKKRERPRKWNQMDEKCGQKWQREHECGRARGELAPSKSSYDLPKSSEF
jgi:hypothetical protein